MQVCDTGRTLLLTLDLKEFPSRPPDRWAHVEHNAVSLELQAWDLENLSLSTLAPVESVSCAFSKDLNGKIEIAIQGANLSLIAKVSYLRVNHIRPYLRSDNE
jgi:hypothetical protein